MFDFPREIPHSLPTLLDRFNRHPFLPISLQHRQCEKQRPRGISRQRRSVEQGVGNRGRPRFVGGVWLQKQRQQPGRGNDSRGTRLLGGTLGGIQGVVGDEVGLGLEGQIQGVPPVGVERGKMRGKWRVEKSQKKWQKSVGTECGVPAGEREKRHMGGKRREKFEKDEESEFPRESSFQLEEEDEEGES